MTPIKRLNILLADDGSQHAQAAVEFLQDLPLPPKSYVLVLRAFNPGQVDVLPQFERSLERTQKQLEGRDLRIETELKLGSPAALILEQAAVHQFDLIVLGARGLRSTVSILLGGVAQHVMEHASCPVLIVRAPYRGFHQVLFPTDGSPSSQHTARYLGKFPLPAGAQVHLIHVLPPIPVPIMMEPYASSWHTVYAVGPIPNEDGATRKKEEKNGQVVLNRACQLLERRGIHPVSSLLRGDAATEIMHFARENQVDLIIAGSHGMTNLQSLWVGSVSRKLVHYSDCSVLLVRAPEKE